MNRKSAKKAIRLTLTFVMVLVFSSGSMQEVFAASGGTYQVPTKIKETYYGSNGVKDTTTHTLKYNKKGLLIIWRRSEGRKIIYTRDKKTGGIKKEVLYRVKKTDAKNTYKVNRKGLPVSGKLDTGQSYKMTYKKGKLKKVRFDNMETTTFYTNGHKKKYVYNDKSDPDTKTLIKYDSHGSQIYLRDYTGIRKYACTYNEQGDLTRCVEKQKKKDKYVDSATTDIGYDYDSAGRIIKARQVKRNKGDDYKTVETFTYSYNNKGSVTKVVYTSKEVYDDGTVNTGTKYVTKLKYKTVKVAKKYRRLVYDRVWRIDPKNPVYWDEQAPFGERLEITAPLYPYMW